MTKVRPSYQKTRAQRKTSKEAPPEASYNKREKTKHTLFKNYRIPCRFLKNLGTTTTFMLAGSIGSAQAAPSAWVSEFGALDIVNTTSSTLLRDNKDPNTVWVLPPTGGKIEFQNFFASGSVGLCSGLKSTIKAQTTIDARIAVIAEKLGGLEQELAEAEKSLALANTALSNAESGDMAGLLALEGQIQTLVDRNQAVVDKLDLCTESCDVLTTEYRDNAGRIKELRNSYDEQAAKNSVATRKYKIAKATKEAAKENYDNVGKRYEDLQLRIGALQATVSASFAAKGKLEGGNAFVSYNSGWNDNIQKLESSFPQYDFKAIPTRNTRFHANIIGAGSETSYYESLPSLLDYTINGQNYMPWGDRTSPAAEVSAFPSSVSGNFRLSLLGACPLVQKDFFSDLNWNPEVNEQGQPIYGISASYEYAMAYKFNVSASYNLYKFYELINKSGTKGGFFSTKSYSSVVEKKLDTDAFKINWTVEDPDSIYTETVRQQIAEDLKRQLTERVLVTMAQPIYAGASPTPLAGGVPPTPGSIVLAERLSDTCGFNIYCQAGGWILRGAQAIWGSSSSESKFQQDWDRTATETWSSDFVSYRGATTGFSKK